MQTDFDINCFLFVSDFRQNQKVSTKFIESRIYEISLFHRAFSFIKFYSHQLMHFLIQPCISLLSYIKIT